MNAKGLLGVLILALAAAGAGAQSGSDHDLRWSSIDGGGGSSRGLAFAVSGTLGQPDAGGGEGGAFNLEGGFWPPWAAALQTPTPAPTETPTPVLTPPATSTPTGTPGATLTATLTATPRVTASPTSRPPSTVTATPTETLPAPTGIPTLTPTPVPGDVNADHWVNSWDLFYFGLDWQESAAVADPRCNAMTDTIVDEQDLLLLLEHWRR